MSTVHLHIGQCGNQIGKEFWLKVSESANLSDDSKRAFITPGGLGQDEGHIRAVFVDSEKKVLQKIIKHGKLRKNGRRDLKLGYGNVLSCATGCGSNWSMGYNQLASAAISKQWETNPYSYTHELDYGEEDSMLKTTMEAVRREIEACDCFSGFVSWHSLAGGTGSGFGSRLCAELRERYPVAYQMNVTVSPLKSGESPLQAYNELLSLSRLQQDADAIIVFENDEILDLVTTGLSRSASFDEINSYVADCMLNVLSPVSSLSPPSGPTVGIEPWELIRSVAPMPNLKFLHCRTVLENRSKHPTAAPVSWDGLNSKLCQQLRSKFMKTKSASGCNNTALATVCVCRDSSISQKKQAKPQIDIAKIATKLKNAQNCVKWNPFPVDVWVDEGRSSKKGVSKDLVKSMTLCSNLSAFGTVHCSNLLKTARIKFDAKAYLHWYERYGTSEADFLDAFEVVENIVGKYNTAIAP